MLLCFLCIAIYITAVHILQLAFNSPVLMTSYLHWIAGDLML